MLKFHAVAEKTAKNFRELLFLPHPVCSMAKISYAACPCLSQLVLAQFALEMCLTAQNR